jgi:hypothetical protein
MQDDAIVMFDSDEAATYRTGLSGWVSGRGLYFGNADGAEKAARYDGCTHHRCSSCGAVTSKTYSRCDDCRSKAELARYYAMPVGEWDGKALVYSEASGMFYESPESAMEFCESGDPRLILCRPIYGAKLDSSFFEDQLPEGYDTPNALQEAIDAFNKAVSGLILSWEPGKHRLEYVPEMTDTAWPDAVEGQA